ncbi:class I SAM-dependent DNA methyltransferase [Fenollaria timonensis]|uniref:class I SAM-dependent DNA methyltransferase n=1 Tax=Fenollaria timonensis TaxID=1723384 RepID=UPI00071D4C8B|nr:class I SAM-dependent methyltransferase [Fenollaria timonensis]
MLDKFGFDLWAEDYDKTVELSDSEDTYPFAGYKEVLAYIYDAVRKMKAKKVLDIGFGTAVLTKKLYDDGLEIHGQDFSKNMLDIAQEKMPRAKLYECDFTKALDKNILSEKYDAILATYSLHHIIDSEKKDFLKALLALLNDGGKIFIGDVSFVDLASLEACREESKDYWDDDEHYPVYESIKKDFPKAIFEKISFCSGVLILEK